MIAALQNRRWVGTVILIAAFVAATWGAATANFGLQSIVTVTAVFVVLAVSLDLVAGAVGLYSLGHAGLFAIGAYGTTLLSRNLDLDVFVLLPIVMLGAGLVGALLGALSLRVSGLYFSITTFIFTIIVYVLLSNSSWTMGLQGLPGPIFPNFPVDVQDVLGRSVVWAVAAVVFIAIVIVWSIRGSAFYPVLLAVRDAEPYARANGVRTSLVKVGIFALSAGLAGMAGWAFSFLVYQSPGQFGWVQSVNLLVMVIIGGMNTRVGPILGAVLVSIFPFVVKIDPFLQEVVFGAVFVAVVVFFPRGITGLVDLARRKIRAALGRDRGVPLESTVAPVIEPVLAGSSASTQVRGGDVALAARGIEFSYVPGVPVLREIDMVVRRGTIHGLIGPNGSGKSTLVNLISGELRPIAGEIELNGDRVERLSAPSRPSHGLMRTFQSAVLVRELSILENTTVGLYSTVKRIAARSVIWPLLHGARRDSRQMRATSATALESVGLEKSWHSAAVGDVPHGIEQLTQLAASIVSEPSVLVLDEPLAGLSGAEVSHVAQILHRLRERGVTVIVIEHQTRFIFDNCDDVTVLAAGELVTSGPAAEVRENARVREVYLGQ
ncbi:ATP-binding cassette domain-containing protein [Leifsonia sp. H3M29-4]|uniref:branched-chain amino acid ABC transporter ATP-binding protein/permease n=1 Tax=Salinibacterium metalliresistens TaxID=3031321 RepID=UPI0023DAD455|nr:ATP-binding cassette domain-containing protein [Salinibacterium metalliresistens]MDF1480004.1 ATP-binding cassette domain-containing protein [Salinibacterium metalliresistens]